MNNPKRIAYIFEEAGVFLTKDGLYYRYDETDGKIKCRRLTREEKDDFLRAVRFHEAKQAENAEEVSWHPVAREENRFDREVVRQRFTVVRNQQGFQNGKVCGIR